MLVYYLREQLMPKSVPPRFLLTLWPVADRFLRAIHRTRPVRADDTGIIRFSLRQYRGLNRLLKDGSEVKAGDTIVELHLNNHWFKRRRNLNLNASQSPREFLGCFGHDLRTLAQQISGGAFGDVAALHGITLLHIAARRLGFQVDELPDSLWKKGARFYMAGLMQVYHLRGDDASGLGEKSWEPKEIWLSRGALLGRYGPIRE
jgi:hypothetical protein